MFHGGCPVNLEMVAGWTVPIVHHRIVHNSIVHNSIGHPTGKGF